MDLTLPLDHAAIERILPHRYPFLLVDRITEFEEDAIEELQAKIAKRHGFLVRAHKHEMYGVCSECQGKARVGRR